MMTSLRYFLLLPLLSLGLVLGDEHDHRYEVRAVAEDKTATGTSRLQDYTNLYDQENITDI